MNVDSPIRQYAGSNQGGASHCPYCHSLNDFEAAVYFSIEELQLGVHDGCSICRSLFTIAEAVSETVKGQEEALYLDNLHLLAAGDRNRYAKHLPMLTLEFCAANDPSWYLEVLFELFVAPDSDPPIDAAWNWQRRAIPSEPLVPQVVGIVKKWAANCQEMHPWCGVSSEAKLPTRVLDLGSPGNRENIKLEITNGARARYIALSYCWGSVVDALTTTTSKLSEHQQRVPWSKLPVVFKDTIELCWELGVRYLWIDALCIIQDDPSDWESEAAKMADVYSSSWLTIAATRCADTAQSLFSSRWTSFLDNRGNEYRCDLENYSLELDAQRKVLLRPCVHVAHRRLSPVNNAKDHIKDAPLLTRAWVFQERVLAPRTLHFHAEELVWECRDEARCECGELDDDELLLAEDRQDIRSRIKDEDREVLRLKTNHAMCVANFGTEAGSEGQHWRNLVSDYAQLDLSYEKDRLPALAGLAADMATPALGRYLAGIWEADLAAGLLWEVICADKNVVVRVDPSTAPSWSWVSACLGTLGFPNYRHSEEVEGRSFSVSRHFSLVHAAVDPPSSNRFGWASCGRLTIIGLVSPCNELVELKLSRMGRDLPMWFSDDGTCKISDEEELYYLQVGVETYEVGEDQCIGLMLRAVAGNPDTYQRVGLLCYEVTLGRQTSELLYRDSDEPTVIELI